MTACVLDNTVCRLVITITTIIIIITITTIIIITPTTIIIIAAKASAADHREVRWWPCD